MLFRSNFTCYNKDPTDPDEALYAVLDYSYHCSATFSNFIKTIRTRSTAIFHSTDNTAFK